MYKSRLLMVIAHRLGAQFRYKLQKIKMQKIKTFLDGSERSMIPIIKGDAERLFFGKYKKHVTLEEFSAGTGISDLTIFTIDDRIIQERKRTDSQPLTSKSQIQVLLAVLDGFSNVKEISIAARLSKTTVNRILKNLQDNGLVSQQNSQYLASYSLPSCENIIAIEAKVKDWKSGVRQALRYKEYADYSYLAIYEDNINSCLENIDLFKKFGIGLIGVSDIGINVHLEATLSDVTTRENKLLAFERFVSIVDESYQSFVVRNNFISHNS